MDTSTRVVPMWSLPAELESLAHGQSILRENKILSKNTVYYGAQKTSRHNIVRISIQGKIEAIRLQTVSKPSLYYIQMVVHQTMNMNG
jgi:hypothetical protein